MTDASKESFYIGIDLGGTAIKAGIADTQGNIIDSVRTPTGVASGTADSITENILRVTETLIAKNPAIKISAIGIGVPGIVNNDGSVSIFANIRVFDRYPLAEKIQTRFGFPAFADNDANNAAQGEFLFGAARGSQNFIAITLGTGIGGAIYTCGAIYKGTTGCAGEFGHMIIVPDGRVCGCGQKGCWETYGSSHSMEMRARELLDSGAVSSLNNYPSDSISAKDIETESLKGDAVALQLFDETAFYIGIGVANLINIFNPESVVIGGGLSHAGDFLFDRIRRAAKTHALSNPFEAVSIIPAALGNKAGILGSAALAMIKSAG
jgi:glucokinase